MDYYSKPKYTLRLLYEKIGKTRNWEPIGAVMLNPDREQPQQKEAA